MTATFLWIIAISCVLIGLVGTFVPVIPGTALVFVGLLVGASADGFQKVGLVPLVFLGLLTAASYAIDLIASAHGTKRVGASKYAMIGAFAGSVIGLFFGLPGIVIGPFAGAAIGEFIVHRDAVRAGKAGLGTWLGLVIGGVLKIALIFVMIGVFVIAYLV
jgi:uncharacterized protein